MKHFYTVPTAVLEVERPRAGHQALSLPDDPDTSLVIVECWPDHQAQDDWESRPEVEAHFAEDSGPAAPALVAGLRSVGAVPADSFRHTLQRLRAKWPAARP